ncbi:endolytic transglycosylase MltG [Basilea psittacipulmonis]|uniref:Endolytic murein transglycosylase n=1 Tax=Basilea psittacipulmonis DSM 24701 TaxID=1072685 RepID=A0A077DCS1_9BURK|nr:endolytic transglycosylase MltG [Basilea psittacipulmonis]AIL32685.1 aminodeoxychorismate lyase [Basilea psittacipulmonis DSM 24701]
MWRFIKYTFSALIFLCLVLVVAIIGKVYHWIDHPVAMKEDKVIIEFPKGTSIRKLAKTMEEKGVEIIPDLWVAYVNWEGDAKLFKAGAYEIHRGDTPRSIIDKIKNGQVLQFKVTLVEGRTTKDYLNTVNADPNLVHTDLSQLKEKLGIPYESMEGLFYPDTYVFYYGASDLVVLKKAYEQAQKILQQEWANRQANLPLKTPYEALILASIVEKETGHPEDRARIAGVFINRLRANMKLQTDPTVIYGMGENYTGRIRKVDLQTDTPWNTYTRLGLPPTPITNPSLASIKAVLHPEEHDYYYFVSKGDTTSAFARNLNEHNKNVKKYILKKGQ